MLGKEAISDSTATTDYAAVAFLDLSGFTALTEAHGDRDAAELAEAFGELARSMLAERDRLIKTIGDAVMVTSPTPQTAVGLIRRITEAVNRTGRFPVLRAGVNYGPTVALGDDIYGGTVNIAARIAAVAGPAQILATTPVADAARAAGLAVTGLGPTTLRNVTEPVEVFAIDFGAGCPRTDIDPDCRMRLQDRTTTTTLAHRGVTYRFCSTACVQRFTARPQQYTPATACPTDTSTREGNRNVDESR